MVSNRKLLPPDDALLAITSTAPDDGWTVEQAIELATLASPLAFGINDEKSQLNDILGYLEFRVDRYDESALPDFAIKSSFSEILAALDLVDQRSRYFSGFQARHAETASRRNAISASFYEAQFLRPRLVRGELTAKGAPGHEFAAAVDLVAEGFIDARFQPWSKVIGASGAQFFNVRIFTPNKTVSSSPSRGGRPSEHNWPDAIEAARKFVTENGLPPRKARLIEFVEAWFKEFDGPKAPDTKDIRKKIVQPLYDRSGGN